MDLGLVHCENEDDEKKNDEQDYRAPDDEIRRALDYLLSLMHVVEPSGEYLTRMQCGKNLKFEILLRQIRQQEMESVWMYGLALFVAVLREVVGRDSSTMYLPADSLPDVVDRVIDYQTIAVIGFDLKVILDRVEYQRLEGVAVTWIRFFFFRLNLSSQFESH